MFLTLVLLSAIPFDDYEFVPSTRIGEHYLKSYSSATFKVAIDQYGNFVPLRKYERPKGRSVFDGGLNLMYETMRTAGTNEVYEFRSKRLIPGGIEIPSGQFIPAVGEKIIDFADYKYSPEARPIYNLPGKFVRKGEEVKPWEVTPDAPRGKRHVIDAEKLIQRQGPAPPESNYVFEYDLSADYTRQYGTDLYYGKLNAYGEFEPSGTETATNLANEKPKTDKNYIPLMKHVGQKEVYEFRCRALIPGVIENGEFIPELGATIKHFEDYQYGKDQRPIYNLPGNFVSRQGK